MDDRGSSNPNRISFRLPGIRALRIPIRGPEPGSTLSSALLLVYGFAGIILLGGGLLILPISSRSGQFTSPVDAIFTATSAVCVTGLVVVDTGTYWSTFGQVVLLVLFQIGGLGFITGATLILLATRRGLGLRQRLLISDALGVERLGGIVGVVMRVAVFSVLTEAVGALIFYLRFSSIAVQAPLWKAVFHAVSAFNNCGMDIFGNFKSLLDFQGDAIVLLVTAALIILGGLGFLVVEDTISNRGPAHASLESKLVLSVTAALLVAGTLFYLVAESGNPQTLGPLQFPQKLLVSFFQSVTPRTAGFSAINITGLKEVTLLFTMFLMSIGGASGSVAGGIKVNTFGILLVTALSSVGGREQAGIFGREFNNQNIHRALTLLLFYFGIVGVAILALSVTESFPLDRFLFETFSALSTVGLTDGVTPGLSVAGRLIIILTMFAGRLGPLTFATLLVHRQQPVSIGYPHEAVRIG